MPPLLRPPSASMLLSSLRPQAPTIPRRSPALSRRNPALSRWKSIVPINSSLETDGNLSHFSHGSTQPVLSSHSTAPAPVCNLGLRRDPDLGLGSLLFVISMVLGSFISLVIVSIPALISFRRLAVSMEKLSKVVNEEVPGTLFSLKLSGLEINDLTSQLDKLRQGISGNK